DERGSGAGAGGRDGGEASFSFVTDDQEIEVSAHGRSFREGAAVFYTRFGSGVAASRGRLGDENHARTEPRRQRAAEKAKTAPSSKPAIRPPIKGPAAIPKAEA